MKINGKEYHIDDFVGWVFIHALTKYQKLNPDDEKKFFEDYRKKGDVDIQFIVDGRVFDFAEIMKEMDRQHDRLVREEAVKVLNNRFSGVIDAIHKIEDDLNIKVREKLGLEPRED